MGIEAGETITGLQGSYRIEARHGEGSFGVTYRARDVSNETVVIVKELRIEKLDDWKALELFEREGRVLASISHPHIPAFRDFFARGAREPLPVSAMSTYDGPEHLSLVLVQEFIEGMTLQQRVDGEEPLALEEAEGILESLLQTLTYLHEHDPPLVHRDIKPGNIILSPNGTPYLVDFGAIQERIRSTGTAGSTIVGTLGFMPMEQVRGDARPASDLYALGVTMVVALAGKPLESLTFDDTTGKLDLGAALPRAARQGLRAVLSAMTEPLLGPRAHSAKETLTLLAKKEASRVLTSRAEQKAATKAERRQRQRDAHSPTHAVAEVEPAHVSGAAWLSEPAPSAEDAVAAEEEAKAKAARQMRGVIVLALTGTLFAVSMVLGLVHRQHNRAVATASTAAARVARVAPSAAASAMSSSAPTSAPPPAPPPRADDALVVPLGNKSMLKRATECRAGSGQSCLDLGTAHLDLVPPDYARAADGYRMACDLSYAKGCSLLASEYFKGRGVEKDRARAATLHLKACDLGYASACAYYGYALTYGDGVTTDLAAARTYCERACRAEPGVGCSNLADLYRDGKGLKADPERAAGLFAQACDGTFKEACVSLGDLYAKGLGVTRDRARAISFYNVACAAKVQAGCDAVAKLNVGPAK